MFNYLKEKMSDITTSTEPDTNHIPSDTLLEYASLFQELDDLSEEGNRDISRGGAIDIPLDDSIELDTVEINLNDGRLSDIPMDAAVQEAVYLRSFDSFYKEACIVIHPLSHRESETGLERRRNNYAHQLQMEYMNDMKLDGIPSFQTMSVLDESVPTSAKIDFGEIKSGLPVAWGMESGGVITQRQIDTLKICEQYLGEALTEVIQELNVNKIGGVETDDDRELIRLFTKGLVTLGIWPIMELRNYKKKNIKEILVKSMEYLIDFDYDTVEPYGAGVSPQEQAMDVFLHGLRLASKMDTVFSEDIRTDMKHLIKEISLACGFISNVNTITKSGRNAGKKIQTLAKDLLKKIKEMDDTAVQESYDISHIMGSPWDNMRPIRLCIPTNNSNTFKAQLVVESFETGEISTYTIEVSPETIQESVAIADSIGKYNSIDKMKKACDKNQKEGIPVDSKTKKEYQESFVKTTRPSRFGDTIVQEGLFEKKTYKNQAPNKGVVKIDKDKDVKLSIVYETIRGSSMIYQRQVQAIEDFLDDEDRQLDLMEFIEEKQTDRFGGRIGKKETIWDLITFKYIIVPFSGVPKNIGKVFIKLENKYDREPFYYSSAISLQKNGNIKGSTNAPKALTAVEFDKLTKGVKFEPYNDSFKIINESMIQEGIDFGDNDGNSQPVDPQQTDNQSAANNTGDNGENLTMDTTEGQPPSDTTNVNPDAQKVDTNDVSDEIAQNVANNQNGNLGEEGLSELDFDNGEDTPEFNTNEGDPEAQLNDLDQVSSEEMDLTEGDPADIKNMTINQLLKAGEQRLKDMTTEELQAFIGDMGADDISEEDKNVQVEYAMSLLTNVIQEGFSGFHNSRNTIIQEALFLNKKNIKKEIKDKLTISLGILNNTEMEIEYIFREFKKEGKPLNRILSKAAKMKKVFNETDCEAIASLNKILSDLMRTIKVDRKPTDGEAQVIRRLLREFISQAKVIDVILKKDNDKKGGEAE